ncbi:MAG: N-acetylglucosamine-6-phosphate deacetylase [Verrucomicrobia bacterium]|nr:N-acetylglucosamine-6-phosphate deacetylase [Verrucomicrobiota bacterium]
MPTPRPFTRFALRGARLFDGDRVLEDHAVLINGERIERVVSHHECPSGWEVIDVGHSFVTPGFIDLQLNGCGGVLFNDAIAPETLEAMHRTNLKSGTTGFLPTLITTSEENMRRALAVVANYRDQGHGGVLGIHLEGPYINPERRGIHSLAAIGRPSPDMVACVIAHGRRFPVLLTLAPECNDLRTLKELVAGGVIVSCGHSNARYEEALAGFEVGVRAATHLFNAMSPWTGRDPGLVGGILDHKEVAAGIIVDGKHVHYASVKIAKSIKQENLFLITDAVTPTGTSMTSFQFAGQTIYVKDGRCVNEDGTLGGALLTMIEAVANCVRCVGIPMPEAIRMAGLYPARVLKRDRDLGRLAMGYIANLAVFDESFRIRGVVDRGEWLPAG